VGLRRRGQDLLSDAIDLGKAATDRIRDTDAGGKVVDSVQKVGQQTADTARKASGAVNQEVARRTDNLALGSYRSEVDAALEELVAVVIAQDAEIRALRDRLDALTAGEAEEPPT
jgi:hypothetical protein